jgi:hypothetical protein
VYNSVLYLLHRRPLSLAENVSHRLAVRKSAVAPSCNMHGLAAALIIFHWAVVNTE